MELGGVNGEGSKCRLLMAWDCGCVGSESYCFTCVSQK